MSELYNLKNIRSDLSDFVITSQDYLPPGLTPKLLKKIWDVLIAAIDSGEVVHMEYKDQNYGQFEHWYYSIREFIFSISVNENFGFAYLCVNKKDAKSEYAHANLINSINLSWGNKVSPADLEKIFWPKLSAFILKNNPRFLLVIDREIENQIKEEFDEPAELGKYTIRHLPQIVFIFHNDNRETAKNEIKRITEFLKIYRLLLASAPSWPSEKLLDMLPQYLP